MVVVTNKRWRLICTRICAGTVAGNMYYTPFTYTCSIGPDVVAKSSIGDANTIYIWLVTCSTIEAIWTSVLVSNDSPTHLAILTTGGVQCSLTISWRGDWSTTDPDWAICVLSPCRRAVLCWVLHIEIGDTVPLSISTLPSHCWEVTYNVILYPFQGSLSCLYRRACASAVLCHLFRYEGPNTTLPFYMERVHK